MLRERGNICRRKDMIFLSQNALKSFITYSVLRFTFSVIVIMRVLFAIVLCSGYLATVIVGTCFQENCPNVAFFFAAGKNMVDKHFLRRYVISTFTVLVVESKIVEPSCT